MSQSSDSSDEDIPVLTDVMVTGHDPHAKSKRPKRGGAHAHGQGHETSHARRHAAAHEAHEEAHGGSREAAHDAAHEAPHEAVVEQARPVAAPSSVHDEDVPELDSVYEPLPEEARTPLRGPAQFVPGEAEFTSGSTAERYVAPPDLTAPPSLPEHVHASTGMSDYDADVLAERLRGRFATYLNGDGRNLIEARCRDAFQDHTTWLVNQITREVALALETEMLSWVREAIREELVKGNGGT